MPRTRSGSPDQVSDYMFNRTYLDVGSGEVVSSEDLPVKDDMDFLGGIGRSFKLMADYNVTDPFSPDVPLVINTGCLTGTAFMTGLRAYFTGYSPLKRTLQGTPMPGWSAMSGSFGRKLVAAGVGDLIITGAASEPKLLVVKPGDSGPEISLLPAPPELVGTRVPEKMKYLNGRFNDREKKAYPAHFAVIGPAGEHFETVWYASIVGSTQEMVMSDEDMFRFAGRLGMGSILGSKNTVGIVAYAEEDVFTQGDQKLKAINQEIGRGDQTRGFRHPNNRDGLGGTGKNARLLDEVGVLPYRNFEPRGENIATPVHLETMRESDQLILIDKSCFGCQIACHQDFYDIPAGGKDPEPRVVRRNHGPYLGRYEFEPMELSGPDLDILDPRENLRLARLDDDLGFDTISVNVSVAFAMDHNSRSGDQIAEGLQFGDAAGAAKLKEDIAYGREQLLGKGVKAASEAIGGSGYAMHCKGVEHSAYLGQTNPGYPFAIAGGHMSMRTFLLYVMDPNCKPDSADYWVEQITKEGWKCVTKDLYGGCLFTLSPPDQVAEAITSIFGVPFAGDRLLEATYQSHILGFALERKQGATLADYEMPGEIFKGERKGDLPGVNFLSRDLFEEIRERVLDYMNAEATRLGYAALADKN